MTNSTSISMLASTTASAPGADNGKSSLQRAVASRKKNGFESCFAQGLDLSEFENNNSASTTTTTSASAELLKDVLRRAHFKAVDDMEEGRLRETIEQRALHLRSQEDETNKAIRMEAPTSVMDQKDDKDARHELLNHHKTAGFLSATILSMHGNDDHGAQKIVKGRNKASKQQQAAVVVDHGPRKSSKASKSGRGCSTTIFNKKKAVKKTNRSKFR